MQLEGTLDLERRRVQRWVSVVAIVVPVFLSVAAATWFIRAFIAPPMIAIPASVAIASAFPPEREPPHSDSAQRVQSGAATIAAGHAGFSEPTSVATLPMFASLALAPPSASLGSLSAATAPEPNAVPAPAQADNPIPAPAAAVAAPEDASPSQDAVDGAPTGALDTRGPITEPVPLPPQRRSVSAMPVNGAVPLPRPRPEPEINSPSHTAAERRIFNAHAAE